MANRAFIESQFVYIVSTPSVLWSGVVENSSLTASSSMVHKHPDRSPISAVEHGHPVLTAYPLIIDFLSGQLVYWVQTPSPPSLPIKHRLLALPFRSYIMDFLVHQHVSMEHKYGSSKFLGNSTDNMEKVLRSLHVNNLDLWSSISTVKHRHPVRIALQLSFSLLTSLLRTDYIPSSVSITAGLHAQPVRLHCVDSLAL